MLKVYRRHNPILCQHTERTWRRCSCPLWADGSLVGKRYHKTLKTRNWDDAQKKAQKLEAEGQEGAKRKTIVEATDAFIRDAEARGLRPSTLKKYRELFSKLKTFTEGAGVQRVDECSVEFLREFRESWKISPLTATKRLEYLRSFFRFCSDSGWIKDNPSKKIKPPKVEESPTLPFTADEVDRILKACSNYPHKLNAIRLPALILLLRYSGLRIKDAVTLPRTAIKDGSLTLRTAKNENGRSAPAARSGVECARQGSKNESVLFLDRHI
jgi:integrase/recombinase XerD